MIKNQQSWMAAFVPGAIFAFFFALPGCGGGAKSSPPVSPTNLQATAVSSSRIDLSWADNSDDEEGFKIEKKAPGGSYSLVTTLTANSNSYSDTGLTAATMYLS